MNQSWRDEWPSPHQKTYTCTHVFERERPAKLVIHEATSWSVLCGGEHPDHHTAYRVVGLGHLVEHDCGLMEILDLPVGFEAERLAHEGTWERIASEVAAP